MGIKIKEDFSTLLNTIYIVMQNFYKITFLKNIQSKDFQNKNQEYDLKMGEGTVLLVKSETFIC